MSNVKIIEIFDDASQATQEHVIIDRGNGEYTSMPKSTYDALITDEAKTK
jgi:hypothetical protein